MDTHEQKRAEENEALDTERSAFERRQAAVFRVLVQLHPNGNGQPTQESLREIDEADAEWQSARDAVEHIVREIRSGKRQ